MASRPKPSKPVHGDYIDEEELDTPQTVLSETRELLTKLLLIARADGDRELVRRVLKCQERIEKVLRIKQAPVPQHFVDTDDCE